MFAVCDCLRAFKKLHFTLPIFEANLGYALVNTGLFINNEFLSATGGSVLDVENPSTGETLASVSAATKEDVDNAVDAAKAAFREWKTGSPALRGKLLNHLADLIEQDAEDLASLQSLEVGTLFGDAKGLDVPQAVETLRYFAGWADKITGQLLSTPQGRAYTQRDPLGVCAAIIPWNAPL